MTTEMTNYEMFQLEKYGNVLPEPTIFPDGSSAEGEDEIWNRAAEWTSLQLEQQLIQHENN